MINRFLKKYCPRCGGNIYLADDLYGWYEACLQCSYTRDLDNPAELREKFGKIALGQDGPNARGSQ